MRIYINKSECMYARMHSMHSGTAGGIRTKPVMGPPSAPGHVLGYPDPGNSGPRGTPFIAGERDIDQ